MAWVQWLSFLPFLNHLVVRLPKVFSDFVKELFGVLLYFRVFEDFYQTYCSTRCCVASRLSLVQEVGACVIYSRVWLVDRHGRQRVWRRGLQYRECCGNPSMIGNWQSRH